MIALRTRKTSEDLTGRSKWWGCPELPDEFDWPEAPDGGGDGDPMTFICQIRCSDPASLDPEGLLPHEGMLWFFAALDYFLGDLDADSPGMGDWPQQYFRVLYSPVCDNLNPHRLVYPDGTPACLPAEAILPGPATVPDATPVILSEAEGYLLGEPYFDEVRQENPGMISLLQIEENDSWGLRFYDCGMLFFLISPEDLAARRFDRVRCWLHSF